jgi:hypothetical protein
VSALRWSAHRGALLESVSLSYFYERNSVSDVGEQLKGPIRPVPQSFPQVGEFFSLIDLGHRADNHNEYNVVN